MRKLVLSLVLLASFSAEAQQTARFSAEEQAALINLAKTRFFINLGIHEIGQRLREGTFGGRDRARRLARKLGLASWYCHTSMRHMLGVLGDNNASREPRGLEVSRGKTAANTCRNWLRQVRNESADINALVNARAKTALAKLLLFDRTLAYENWRPTQFPFSIANPHGGYNKGQLSIMRSDRYSHHMFNDLSKFVSDLPVWPVFATDEYGYLLVLFARHWNDLTRAWMIDAGMPIAVMPFQLSGPDFAGDLGKIRFDCDAGRTSPTGQPLRDCDFFPAPLVSELLAGNARGEPRNFSTRTVEQGLPVTFDEMQVTFLQLVKVAGRANTKEEFFRWFNLTTAGFSFDAVIDLSRQTDGVAAEFLRDLTDSWRDSDGWFAILRFMFAMPGGPPE